jgi:hypothetical protein|nr:MAG TPA: Polynucleotide kinase [Caudoviricetes sp.]
MKEKIILLDLNYTLVANQRQTRMIRPFSARLKAEEYRKDLIEVIKDNRVVIITARPSYQGSQTMENILRKTDLRPEEAYFNDLNLDPPSIKESILKRFVFPKYGNDGKQFFAVESNPRTRAMYARYGIPAEPYDRFIQRFPDIAKDTGKSPVQYSLFPDYDE